jgi:hypothetical protein
MGMKSPSKFLSLSYLIELRDNDYCNKDRGIDYVPCEVDELIWAKQEEMQEKIYIAQMKEQEEFELEMQKKKRVKTCTKCKREKNFDNFHIDKSKKNFGLRSHCLKCRGMKNEIKHTSPRNFSVKRGFSGRSGLSNQHQ